MKGFAESGGGFEFAVGSVTGVRWWTIDQDLMRTSLEDLLPPQSVLEPVRDDPRFPVWGALPPYAPARRRTYDCMLVGAWGPWAPGENLARCNRGGYAFGNSAAETHEPPDDECMCGFWAYWDLTDAPHGDWDVAGVIQGYGRSTIGPLGFRVQKAKIIALHLSTTVEGCDEHGQPVGDQAAAQKWQVDMEDMLGRHYGVRMWSSLDAMAAAYPPNEDYATEAILAKSRERVLNIRERNAHHARVLGDETAADAARRYDDMIRRFKKADENDTRDTGTQGAT